jgi:hypothetical protein
MVRCVVAAQVCAPRRTAQCMCGVVGGVRLLPCHLPTCMTEAAEVCGCTNSKPSGHGVIAAWQAASVVVGVRACARCGVWLSCLVITALFSPRSPAGWLGHALHTLKRRRFGLQASRPAGGRVTHSLAYLSRVAAARCGCARLACLECLWTAAVHAMRGLQEPASELARRLVRVLAEGGACQCCCWPSWSSVRCTDLPHPCRCVGAAAQQHSSTAAQRVRHAAVRATVWVLADCHTLRRGCACAAVFCKPKHVLLSKVAPVVDARRR